MCCATSGIETIFEVEGVDSMYLNDNRQSDTDVRGKDINANV